MFRANTNRLARCIDNIGLSDLARHMSSENPGGMIHIGTYRTLSYLLNVFTFIASGLALSCSERNNDFILLRSFWSNYSNKIIRYVFFATLYHFPLYPSQVFLSPRNFES